MSNLAVTYRDQGKHRDAEVLYKQCFDQMKEVLGENHPDTLITMNNLAVTYRDQGKHREAEVLCKLCLDKMKEVLGENHPDTLSTMNNLTDITSKLESVSLG